MVVVFLAEGFEEVEALAPVDVMRRAGLAVKLAGVTGREVTGSHGICVQTDMDAQEVDATLLEAMVLPRRPARHPQPGGFPCGAALHRQLRGRRASWWPPSARRPPFWPTRGCWPGKNATAFPSFQKDLQEGGAPPQRKLCGAGRPVPHRPGHGRGHPVIGLALVEALVSPEKAADIRASIQWEA